MTPLAHKVSYVIPRSSSQSRMSFLYSTSLNIDADNGRCRWVKWLNIFLYEVSYVACIPALKYLTRFFYKKFSEGAP